MEHPPLDINAQVVLLLYTGLSAVVASMPISSFVFFLAASDSCLWDAGLSDGLSSTLACLLFFAIFFSTLDCFAFLLLLVSPNVFASIETVFQKQISQIRGSNTFRPLLPVAVSSNSALSGGAAAPASQVGIAGTLNYVLRWYRGLRQSYKIMIALLCLFLVATVFSSDTSPHGHALLHKHDLVSSS